MSHPQIRQTDQAAPFSSPEEGTRALKLAKAAVLSSLALIAIVALFGLATVAFLRQDGVETASAASPGSERLPATGTAADKPVQLAKAMEPAASEEPKQPAKPVEAAAAFVISPPTELIDWAKQVRNSQVPVADDEAEVAALEEATGMVEALPPEQPQEIARIETAGALTTQAVRQDIDPSRTAAIDQAELRPARVLRWVNMRTRPADEASTVTVVPANTSVQAQANCGWCMVEFGGKRGYIYKSFLQAQ